MATLAAKSKNGEIITAARVADWLRLLCRPGEVVELRAIDVAEARWSNTYAGYFDHQHLHEMADEALRLSTRSAGVYFTLNPVNPDLIFRCHNRTKVCIKKDQQVCDGQITRRSWLLVDVDPVRLSGIPSSDTEKAAALEVANEVRDHLRHDQGWPDPIFADSGNGWHLLYSIDLPADDGGLVERCVKALAQRFDTDLATVDTSVFNPSRITKLYGTTPHKGDATPLRPHRPSLILESPSTSIVTVEQLNGLAENYAEPAPRTIGSTFR